MNFSINYYQLLGLNNQATDKEIKKFYYRLSFEHHPDHGGDPLIFGRITEGYDILMDAKKRKEYDCRSKWGKDYDESTEFFNYEFYNPSTGWDEEKLKDFKKKERLNVVCRIDDSFDGSIEYERWVVCKKCKGTGKDDKSKIEIKDESGNIVKVYDSDGGCDFCFEENNYVITKSGAVKISEIKVNEMVLSSNNTYEKVTHLLKRVYTGKVLDINVSGLKINGITDNHKLNIARFKKNKHGRIIINDYEIMEIPASELLISDYVIYQNQMGFSKDKVVLEKTHNRKSKELLIDSNFIKFISCYISEGNTRGGRVVVFTFHKEKDSSLIEFIEKYTKNQLDSEIKFISNEKWGDKVAKIEIHNSQLAKFLDDFCGHLAENKFINPDILGKHDNILLDTLLMCDGYKKNNCSTYTTISKKLAYQIFHISQNLGYNSSIGTYNEYVDKNGIRHMTCYRVYITKLKKMGISKKVIKEGICLKVKSIEKRNIISTNVYNITVNNTHKYTIDGLLVNNCEGTGKGYNDEPCTFCFGQGKVGSKPCKTCNGEKRILGKQKLTGILFPKDAKDFKVEFMGNFSKDIPGKVGHLWLVKSS